MTKTKNKSKEDVDGRLFNEYLDFMAQNDLVSAVQALDELLKITFVKSFVYTLKVDVLSQLGQQSEALEASNLAIKYPNPSSKLYKLRAELLLSLGQTTEDLQLALNSIDQAIALYDQESASEDIQSRFDNVESFKFWFSEKTRSRTDMASLKADIKSLLYSLNIYNQVQDIQNSLAQEKIKTIELMAIFTAILALIFANVQFFSGLRLREILIANASLVVAITWMLWIVQRIGLGRSFFPKLNSRAIFATVMTCCTVVLAVVGTGFVLVSFVRWLL